MIDKQDFLTWVSEAIEAYAEHGGDLRYAVSMVVEDDVVECAVEFWNEDNNSNEPDAEEMLNITIK